LLAAMGAGASTNLAWEPSVLGPSANEIIKQIKGGERTCVDIVQASLDRIALLETSERPLNACVETLAESALDAARAVDAKVKNKQPMGLLEGLPIVVKVNIDVKGSLTTASTAALKEWRPPAHAPCVSKLVEAGAIVVARANMCELAVGFSGNSPVHGLCLNPRNPSINVGGSSSGTASSVAAGVVSCGLGTDTGGSLRGPAALCGVVGFRPSSNRWPGKGVMPVSSLRDTPGPIGACVEDICLLDAVATSSPVVEARDVTDLKIGIPRDWLATAPNGLDENALAALDAASAALRKSGALVEDVDGFCAVTETNKATWPIPVLPVPFENNNQDLATYVEAHQDALGLDVEALRSLDRMERKLYFASLDDDSKAQIARRAHCEKDEVTELLDNIGTLTVETIQDKVENTHIRSLFDAPIIPQDVIDERLGFSQDPDRPMAKNLTELKKWESEERGRRFQVKDEDLQNVVEEVINEKTQATLMGVEALEAAYRSYFEENGIRCLLLPTFAQPPGRIDVKGYAAKAFTNEYHWLFHLNEIPIPSITLPTSVVFPGSMIPASVLLYGLDDAELLGIARTLEGALGGVSDWAVTAFGGRRTLGGAP
jgi:Asp-tRNA(Asn)/Glu-tRNA(Gln) amidotransferase A subunit family amidase